MTVSGKANEAEGKVYTTRPNDLVYKEVFFTGKMPIVIDSVTQIFSKEIVSVSDNLLAVVNSEIVEKDTAKIQQIVKIDSVEAPIRLVVSAVDLAMVEN